MKLSRSLFVPLLLTLRGVVAVAIGIPPPYPSHPVTRQSNDGFGNGEFHLVNCSPRNYSVTGEQWLSLVIYCENNTDCNDPNHVPAQRDICIKKASNVSGDYQRWENSEWQSCRFVERGPFGWVLVRLARLFPPGTAVGIGEDEEKRDYTAFNDDESLGAGPVTHTCSKLFYISLDSEAPPPLR